MEWPYFDPEYETLSQRINPPRVVIDNSSSSSCTLVKSILKDFAPSVIDHRILCAFTSHPACWKVIVGPKCSVCVIQLVYVHREAHYHVIIELTHFGNNVEEKTNYFAKLGDGIFCSREVIKHVDSANKHGTLLEVVQVLTDLDLLISKAYICSDGGWFMDVFHVTDQLGCKLTDENLIEYIQQALGAKRAAVSPCVKTCLGRTVGVQSVAEYTSIEMTGSDRPGLLSEISAILTKLKCNVVAAEVWTHNLRVACVVYVTDENSGGLIEDPARITAIKEQLCNVLKASSDDKRRAKTDFSMGFTHTERRLHQLMFADRDYEVVRQTNCDDRPCVSIENCVDKGYSVVNIRCKDRPKLLFDTVCTLTDMQYVVFHAAIDSDGPYANQEYYIRHMDGSTVDTHAEKQRVIKCLEAAIERRASQGIRLELCTSDKIGLLSEVTRIFCENGLSVTRADVMTEGGKAVNTFYVTNASGSSVDMKVIEATRKAIGQQILLIKEVPILNRVYMPERHDGGKLGFSFGSLIKSQWEKFSSNLGLSSHIPEYHAVKEM